MYKKNSVQLHRTDRNIFLFFAITLNHVVKDIDLCKKTMEILSPIFQWLRESVQYYYQQKILNLTPETNFSKVEI